MTLAVTLAVAPAAIAAMREASARAAPHEACGLLLGTDARIEAVRETANVAPDPACHFEIDPAALIAAHRNARNGGAVVLGYFHSHPNGLARPSATDAASAARDNRVWGIVAGTQVTFWRDAPCGFEPLSYVIAQG